MILIYLTAIACGILTIFILTLIIEYVRRFHIDIFHALRYYIDLSKPPKTFSDYQSVQWIIRLVRSLASFIPQLQSLTNLDQKLRQAGLPVLGTESIIIAILLAVVAGLIVFSLTISLAISILAGASVIFIFYLAISLLVQRRQQKFVNQLGDCLTTVANALRAGFSFTQAMDLVSKEMEPPISEEFAHVMRDVSYGMPLEQALEDMDGRVASADFSLVVTAVLIQREVGGNLAQVLDTISDTIKDRIRMRREILAITAQGRMSAWVLAGIPVFIAIVELIADPHHFDEMLDSGIGFPALIFAVISEIVGFAVIRKIVNIKVE